jgi:hypothetical protein
MEDKKDSVVPAVEAVVEKLVAYPMIKLKVPVVKIIRALVLVAGREADAKPAVGCV